MDGVGQRRRAARAGGALNAALPRASSSSCSVLEKRVGHSNPVYKLTNFEWMQWLSLVSPAWDVRGKASESRGGTTSGVVTVLMAAGAAAFAADACEDTRCKRVKKKARESKCSEHGQQPTLNGSQVVSGLAFGNTPEGVTSTMQLNTADSGPAAKH